METNGCFSGILRGALIVVVLFVFAFAPMTMFARPLQGDDAPPGNVYIPAPSLTNVNTQPTAPVRTWRSSMLQESSHTRRQEGLDIRGVIPVISDSFDSSDFINANITDDIVTSLIAEARRLRARSITFSYEYHPTEEIISIVIYANISTTLPQTLARSVNFSARNGSIISMNEATGIDIIPLAERILAERIRSNPELYHAALSASLANQAFYLTDYSLVILFDGFRLSAREGEVDTIEIILANINSVVLYPDDYRQDGPYDLKMIPLRAMLEGQLGFDVIWDEYSGRVTIARNGVLLIELNPNDNEYIVYGTHTQRRSLEAAPQIYDGYTYIPITFFDQILPFTTFSIDIDGSITILSYLME
ncbi:MAG: copper amine oxidase N-terminal domain-containing protein [Clostridiales bacterium]|jgi:hypothetical protein|nr:copper amine oxidase N-terminal domain-containing protein [Clostridiales bacterium]